MISIKYELEGIVYKKQLSTPKVLQLSSPPKKYVLKHNINIITALLIQYILIFTY